MSHIASYLNYALHIYIYYYYIVLHTTYYIHVQTYIHSSHQFEKGSLVKCYLFKTAVKL